MKRIIGVLTVFLIQQIQIAVAQEPTKSDLQTQPVKKSGKSKKDGSPKVKETPSPPDTNINKEPCCCDKEESKCIPKGEAAGTTDILVDFKSKQIGKKKEWYNVKKGDFVRIKVMNYNPLLYKVVINSTDSSVSSPFDAKILTSFFDPSGLTSITGSLAEKAGISPIPTNLNDESNYMQLKDPSNDDNTISCNPFINICPLDHDKCTTITKKTPAKRIAATGKVVTPEKTIIIVDTAACLKSYYTKVATFLYLENLTISKLKKGIDAKLYEALRINKIRSELYPDCESFKKTVIDELIKGFETKFDGFYDSLTSIIGKENNHLNEYLGYMASYQPFIQKNAELKINDSLARKFFTEAMTALKKLRDDIGYDKLASLVSKMEMFKLYSSCFTSLPIYINDDVKKINLELKNIHDSLNLPGYSTSLILPFLQKKVWGVSSGLFLSGLRNENYNVSVAEINLPGGGKDTVYNLIAEKRDDLQIGAGAQAYIGWRANSAEKPNYWGLTFGAGLSIEAKPKPRVLLGGTFITGEKNRFAVSVGLVCGYVRRLSNAFNASTPYTLEPKDITRDQLEVSSYLSLSFSFLNK